LLSNVFPDIIYNIRKTGVTVAFGGASISFIREIPMFWKYNLHTRVISWSPQGKWLYLRSIHLASVFIEDDDSRREEVAITNAPE
jgi:hypothetical protein